MLTRKISALIAIALFATALGNASELESGCKNDGQKQITVKRTTPSHPLVQEFSIQCGSQTSTQTSPSVSQDSNSTNKSEKLFAWEKLLDSIFNLLGRVAWPIA